MPVTYSTAYDGNLSQILMTLVRDLARNENVDGSLAIRP